MNLLSRLVHRSMFRAALVVSTLASILILAVGGAGAAGAYHETQDVTGDQFICYNGDIYTIASGTLSIVVHEGSTPSGNFNVTGTLTPNHVTAIGPYGDTVQIVGAGWFGAAGHDSNFVVTDTEKFQILGASGGPVATVNLTTHITVNANHVQSFAFDFGDCATPED